MNKKTPLILRFLVTLIVAGILASCASLKQSSAPSYVWPEPPDEPRVAYEFTLKNADSLQSVSPEDKLKAFATGQANSTQSSFLKPYDIAAQDGLIVVTDSLLNVAHVFDVPRKKLFSIGWRKEGKLIKPLGVAMDSAQNIYIVDGGRGIVIKYDRLGLFLGTFGVKSDFSRISDIAVSAKGDKVYVLDRGGVDSNMHRVTVYDGKGKKLKTIGQRGHRPGEFNHPTQLALNKNGKLFVLDSGNFRVQIFNEQGVYENKWGRPGNNAGNFARPRGIAVDDFDRVFVTDSAYQNFQIFNENGQLLLSVGSGGGEDLPGQYMLPAGIAVDETQRVYVVDQIRRKVEVYRMLGVNDAESSLKQKDNR